MKITKTLKGFCSLMLAILLMFSSIVTVKAVTQSAALTWIYAQEGEYLNVDEINGAQCVDLVKAYYAFLTGDISWHKKGLGNAWEYVSNEKPSICTRYTNTPTFLPLPGDVAVWNQNEGGGDGHVAIVVSADLNNFVSLDQNWPKGYPCNYRNHNYNNISCFIRPTWTGSTITVPGAITNLSATPGNAQATLTWTAPSNGGSAITRYDYRYSTNNGSTWSSWIEFSGLTTTRTMTSMTNGTTYVFQVRAVNSIGAGNASNSASVTPTAGSTVPGAITNLSATPGNAQATLTWTAPSNGGSAITRYDYRYSTNGGSTWTSWNEFSGLSTTRNMTGMTNGTTYVFQVRAVNSIGAGNASNSASVTPTSGGGGSINWSLWPTGSITFTSANVGYGQQSYERIEIDNNGPGTLNGVSASITTGSNYFEIAVQTESSVPPDGEASDWFAVRPKTGLSAGTYNGVVTVSSSNGGSKTKALSFTVNSSSLTISPTTDWANIAAAGGATRVVTVTSNTSWTVSKPTWLNVNTSSGSNNGSFTLTAQANTSSSSRSGTVSVTGGGITRSFSVSQLANAQEIDWSLWPVGITFDLAVVGYGIQTAEYIWIDNYGPGSLTGVSASITTGSNAFEIAVQTETAIPADGEDSDWFRVRPKTELSVGTYTGVATVTTSNGGSKTVSLSFTVGPFPTANPISLTQSNPTVVVNIGSGSGGRIPLVITAPSTDSVSVQSSNTTSGSDPALYNASGTRIADDEAGGMHWRYTVPANQSMTVYAGTYENGAASYTVTATFPAITPEWTLTPTAITFPLVTVGYGTQTAQSVTIGNTGTVSLNSVSASITTGSSSFEITASPSSSISAGGTSAVSVRPKTGLAAGTYAGELTVATGNGGSKTVQLSFTVNAPAPTIAITTEGLSNLKVGQAVSNASVKYTLTNGTYATSITPSSFTVAGLPSGLSAGTAARSSDTVVSIPITGTPTTYNASTTNLTFSPSIPATNVTGAASAIVPTGTITTSAIAKGDGAAVSGAPTEQSRTENSITVNAVTNSGTTGQSVEYAISTSGMTTPSGGWQSGTMFGSLAIGSTYYVYARTAATTNYNAGTARVSVGISLYSPPSDSDLTFSVGSAQASPGKDILVPINVTNNNDALDVIVVTVTFDSARLEWQDLGTYVPGNTATHPWMHDGFIPFLSNPGSINVNSVIFYFMDQNGVYVESGALITLKLHVKDDAPTGDAAITLSFTSVGDSRGALNSSHFNNESGKVTVSDITYGDVNGDGTVDAFDALYLARHLAEWPGYETILLTADVNGDGVVDAFDSLYLARYLAEWPGYEILGPK